MTKYLLLLLAFMPPVARAQKQGMALADSLIKELNSPRYRERNDTVKARLYVMAATALYPIPDSSIRYAKLGVDLSGKLRWEHGIAIAYTSLCYDYSAVSDFTQAISYGKKALEINEKQGRTKDVVSSLGNLANCYVAQSNLEEAIETLLKALTLAEQENDKLSTALISQSLGIAYDQLKDYSRSKRYYLEALKIFEQINSQSNIAMILTNLAQSYENELNFTGALNSVLRAIKIFESDGNKYALMVSTGIAGSCYRNLRDYPRALAHYRRALELNKAIGSVEYSASSNKGLGEAFLDLALDTNTHGHARSQQRGYIDSAIAYFEKALSEGNTINISDVVANVSQSLAEAYELKGNYKVALAYYKAYKAATDSVYSSDHRLKISSLETQREKSLKDKQIEINRIEEIKKRDEQALLIAGLIGLLIAVIAVLRAHNKQKKANREKEGLLHQKDMLMKEIHHRVKNNLQVISTLLDLQLLEVTDEQAKGAMAESTTRVRSMSLIHQQLYQHDDLGAIEFSKFAGELVRQVTVVFKKGDIDVAFNNNIPDIHFDIDTAVPLGLILNELITNSFKYAFSGSAHRDIYVGIQQENGGYKLIYTDSGPGLPDDALQSSGLGMRMMRSLSKQIGGRFTYDAVKKNVIITFKDLQGRKMID